MIFCIFEFAMVGSLRNGDICAIPVPRCIVMTLAFVLVSVFYFCPDQGLGSAGFLVSGEETPWCFRIDTYFPWLSFPPKLGFYVH